MFKKTEKAMLAFALTLPASTERAQCYTIANYTLGEESIAEKILSDHCNKGHAYRAAMLIVDAGAATFEENPHGSHFCGKITFEDGSVL